MKEDKQATEIGQQYHDKNNRSWRKGVMKKKDNDHDEVYATVPPLSIVGDRND